MSEEPKSAIAETSANPELNKIVETSKIVSPPLREILIKDRQKIEESIKEGQKFDIQVNKIRGASFTCNEELPGFESIQNLEDRVKLRERLSYKLLSGFLEDSDKIWLQSREPNKKYVFLSFHDSQQELVQDMATFVNEKAPGIIQQTWNEFKEELNLGELQEAKPEDFFHFGVGKTLGRTVQEKDNEDGIKTVSVDYENCTTISLMPSADGETVTVAESSHPDIVTGAILSLGTIVEGKNSAIFVEKDADNVNLKKGDEVVIEIGQKGRKVAAYAIDPATVMPRRRESSMATHLNESETEWLSKFSSESYLTPKQISELIGETTILGEGHTENIDLNNTVLLKNTSVLKQIPAQVFSADLSGYSKLSHEVSQHQDPKLERALINLMGLWHSRMYSYLSDRKFGMDEIGGDGSQAIRVGEGKKEVQDTISEALEAQNIWNNLLIEAQSNNEDSKMQEVAQLFGNMGVTYKMAYAQIDARLQFIGKGKYTAVELVPQGEAAGVIKDLMYAVKHYIASQDSSFDPKTPIVAITPETADQLRNSPALPSEKGFEIFDWIDTKDMKKYYFARMIKQ